MENTETEKLLDGTWKVQETIFSTMAWLICNFFFLWRNDSKLIVLLSKFAKASAVKFNRNKIVPVEETGK